MKGNQIMKTNEKKMKFEGASPIIFLVTILASIPIIAANYTWKSYFEIQIISRNALMIIAISMLVFGIPLYAATIKKIKKGFKEEKLITKGVFSVCRNPLFAFVIFLLLPVILLFFKSWLLLIIPAVLLISFYLFIGSEEKLLEKKFGKEFLAYKKNTSKIIPLFWEYKK